MRVASAFTALALLGIECAQAQGWAPQENVELVVPVAPGGTVRSTPGLRTGLGSSNTPRLDQAKPWRRKELARPEDLAPGQDLRPGKDLAPGKNFERRKGPCRRKGRCRRMRSSRGLPAWGRA